MPHVRVVVVMRRFERWLRRCWWKEWWSASAVGGRFIEERVKLVVVTPDERWPTICLWWLFLTRGGHPFVFGRDGGGKAGKESVGG